MTRKTAASRAARLPVSPPVLWTGIALGVFFAVEAVIHDVVLPLTLGAIADAALTFLLIVAAAVAVTELTRRHHRAVLRHGGRLSAAGARHARRHGSGALAWLAARAGSWWAGREHRPLMFRRPAGEAEDPAEAPKAAVEADGPTYSFGHARQRAAWPATSLEDATARARQMSTGGEPYVVTEYPPGGGPGRTVAVYVHGKPSQPEEGNTTMPPSKISTGHRAQRASGAGAAGVASEWAAVVGQTADFEPESDGERSTGWAGRSPG